MSEYQFITHGNNGFSFLIQQEKNKWNFSDFIYIKWRLTYIKVVKHQNLKHIKKHGIP